MPVATRQLADLWARATDRNAVSAAAARIDIVLRDNPEAQAMSHGRFHVRIEDPLAVLFEIAADDCMVRVLLARRAQP